MGTPLVRRVAPWCAAILAVSTAAAAEGETPYAAVTFGPERGLHISVNDGAHWFQLQTAIWWRGVLEWDEDIRPDYALSVPLVRPVFQASIADGLITTFIQPEFAERARLLDASIDINIRPQLRIRAGVFRTPYSRAYITPIIQLGLPGRGLVSDTFRLDRSTGAMIFGLFAGGALEYQVGVFATAPTGGSTNAAPLVVARIAYHIGQALPYDQVPALRGEVAPGASIALSGALQRESSTNGSEVFRWHGSVDATVAVGTFMWTAEGFIRESSTGSASSRLEWGVFTQAGVFVVPQLLELVARGSWLDRDDLRTQAVYEGGLNVYIPTGLGTLGHNAKLQLAYSYTDVRDARATDTQQLLLQLQASF